MTFLTIFVVLVLPSLNSAQYRVAVIEEAPFVTVTINSLGRSEYGGFLIDVIGSVADMNGFTFEAYTLPSSAIDRVGNAGDALVQELVNGNADIGLGPLRATATRQQFVAFATPYMMDDFGLIIKRRFSQGNQSAKFQDQKMFNWWMEEFRSIEFYKILIPTCFGTTMILWIWDLCCLRCKLRYNGYSKSGRIFWLLLGPLTPPADRIAMRLIGLLWWFAALMLAMGISTYFNQREITTITSLRDAVDRGMALGVVQNSEAEAWLKTAAESEEKLFDAIGPLTDRNSANESAQARAQRRVEALAIASVLPDTYTNAWRLIHRNGPNSRSGTVLNRTETGLKMVREGFKGQEFGFIGASSSLKYAESMDCSVGRARQSFGSGPLAMAVQQGSPIKDQISGSLLQLINQGEIERLQKKWWNTQRCFSMSARIQPENLSDKDLKVIGSLAVIVGIALLLSVIICSIDCCCHGRSHKHPEDIRYRKH